MFIHHQKKSRRDGIAVAVTVNQLPKTATQYLQSNTRNLTPPSRPHT